MLPGVVPAQVPEWFTEVTVNGVVRAAESMSWSSEMTGDLPDQVIASGGLGGADGTIVWSAQQPVESRPVSPWGKVAGWPPSAGDLVQIRVGNGTTWWTRFTGVIDKTTGDPTSGFQSRVIDFRDRISGTFTHEALLRHMPPFQEDGSYRSIGLNFWYALTRALRTCGISNTPLIEAPSAMSAPLQGSVWPEAGDLLDAGGSGSAANASFFQEAWGYSAVGFNAHYIPRLSESPSTTVQLTMMVGAAHSGIGYVEARYQDVRIRLRASSARGITAHHIVGTTDVQVAVLSPAAFASAETVSLLVKNGQWTLRADNGSVATGSRAVSGSAMHRVSVSADDNARIAGVQVSHPNTVAREFTSVNFRRNMEFDPSGLASTMDMMPALRGRSIPDLVDEILAATLTASWWDEGGKLILRPSDRLRGTVPSATVTTSDDITALSWEDSLLAVKSEVEVAWKNPLISKTYQHRLELWRGRTQTLLSTSDPISDWVTPDPGMEWFGVDRTLRRINSSSWGAYNARRGSYCGVWLSNADGDPDPRAATIPIESENLYADSMKITTSVVSLLPELEANTETHPEDPALKPYLRGQPLPVVRGMGRGEWVDETYRASAGPSTAPVLSHDLGYWGGAIFGGGSIAQRIGDYLAQMVTAPQPTITNLGLVYDPRRQVGDVYTITSSWLGIELRVLVVGLSEDHGDGARQSATVRVISATSTRPVTYDDLAAAWTSGNYTGLQAAWSALTYDDMAADPLRGAPS